MEIISTPEVAKTEPPVLEKPQIEEVKCPVLPSVRDCLTHILTDITELQKPIEGNIDYDFRLHWRNAQLQNLVGYVLRLRASKAKKFNASAIFDQTDIAHRMIESSLEIALSHYPVISDEQSILREIADNGHQLHLSAQKLLRSNACTENLRAFVWNFRSVIYDISSANSCGNYLYSTAAKMPSLPHQAKKIAQFLLMVDRESLILTPNDTMRSALLAKHNQRLNNSLYFVEQLLEIIINPQSAIPTTLPSTVEIDALLNDELKSLQNIHFKQNAPVMRLDSTNNSENDSSLPEVATLQCALRALRNARTLITIRIFCQVQGLFDAQHRTDERNCALKNLDLYLRRLIEKLSTDRTREPYATLCSEWSLIRRAHKELTIAALLNGAFFADGAHVVDTQQLRYSNNPNHLMKVLKSNVREPAKLPHLGTWLAKAHPVLSYQAPLQQVEFQDNEANLMRDKLNKLRQITQDKSKIKGGYTLMRDGVNITVADLTTEAEQHLINDEKEKLFPAIIALHQTLKFGMPLQQSHLGTQ